MTLGGVGKVINFAEHNLAKQIKTWGAEVQGIQRFFGIADPIATSQRVAIANDPFKITGSEISDGALGRLFKGNF